MKINTNRSTNYRWIYVLLSIILMIIYGTVYSWGVFRLPVEKIYGVGATLSGLPYMTFLLVYAISMLIGGKMIGKYSPRLLLIFGGVIISLGWILSSFSNSIFLLTISYGIIIGFGVGISYGVPIYVIASWFPNKKGIVIGMILAGFGLSPIFTAPLGYWFYERFGLKETFLYYGIIFGILIILVSLSFRMPQIDNNTIEFVNGHTNKKSKMTELKSFKFSYICFFLGTLIGLTIIGLTNNIGRELIGLDSKTIASLMIVFALFNGIGRPLFGWITEKYGSQISIRISFSLVFVASIVMLFASEGMIFLYLLIFSILWLNLGAWLAIAPIMTMNLYGMESYSKNYGIMFTAYGLGAVVGVSSSGLLIDLLKNYKAIFVLITILSVIGFILSKKVIREDKTKDTNVQDDSSSSI